MNKKITVKTILLRDLEQFAASCRNGTDADQLIPISPARVRAQINNPCAEGDDIAMVAAFSGSRCVGYHGLLPGYFLCNGEVVKVYWATTFFVSPAMRGKGVGKLLIEAILRLDVDFIITRMTESAERAYLSMGLESLGDLRYMQLRADKLKKLLSEKGTSTGQADNNPSSLKTSILAKVDQAIFPIVKKIFYTRLLREVSARKSRMVVREVAEIDEWPERILQRHAKTRFFRPVTIVNWMLTFPWIFSRNEMEDEREYYFSTTRDFFTYKAFQIYSKDRKAMLGITVVSILSHRGRTIVKLLDYDFLSPDLDYMALVLALRCARKYSADRVEYTETLHRHLPHSLTTKRLVKQQERLYLFHPGKQDSPLAKNRENIVLDYCDGDIVFT